jgi:hypothetical protein
MDAPPMDVHSAGAGKYPPLPRPPRLCAFASLR